ncbi:hypothetical protein FQZ97_745800 [compost metagenome]
MPGPQPVTPADQVTRHGEQQPWGIAVAQRVFHFGRQHRMPVRQHHGVNLPLADTMGGKAVQQADGRPLATAGTRRRREERIGPGHDQDVHSVLLDQQCPARHLHMIVVVRTEPLDPGPPGRTAKQRATVQLATSSCQCGNTAVHNLHLSTRTPSQ